MRLLFAVRCPLVEQVPSFASGSATKRLQWSVTRANYDLEIERSIVAIFEAFSTLSWNRTFFLRRWSHECKPLLQEFFGPRRRWNSKCRIYKHYFLGQGGDQNRPENSWDDSLRFDEFGKTSLKGSKIGALTWQMWQCYINQCSWKHTLGLCDHYACLQLQSSSPSVKLRDAGSWHVLFGSDLPFAHDWKGDAASTSNISPIYCVVIVSMYYSSTKYITWSNFNQQAPDENVPMRTWTNYDSSLDDSAVWKDMKNLVFDLVKQMGSTNPEKRGTAVDALFYTQLLLQRYRYQF